MKNYQPLDHGLIGRLLEEVAAEVPPTDVAGQTIHKMIDLAEVLLTRIKFLEDVVLTYNDRKATHEDEDVTPETKPTLH